MVKCMLDVPTVQCRCKILAPLPLNEVKMGVFQGRVAHKYFNFAMLLPTWLRIMFNRFEDLFLSK